MKSDEPDKLDGTEKSNLSGKCLEEVYEKLLFEFTR
jgi:hypothetical protein